MDNLIIYELNEVPSKLLKKYVSYKPKSNFAKVLNEGIFKITTTKDNGELHPWSTWPTLHRGVPNYKHNIRFINQDLVLANKKYPPFWIDLGLAGIDVGIFGSLQSFPPVYGKNFKFYLPDTFSPNEESFPSRIKDFQRFNLKLVGRNKAINGKHDWDSLIMFLKLVLFGNFSLKSLRITIFHLIKEVMDSKYKKRRSLIQPILGFDVFWKHFLKYQPKLTTFFTNHVAGMMHRYWKDTFPEDFGLELKDINKFNSKSIYKAMDIADEQVGKLIKYCDKNSSTLLIMSSMGQESIEWGEYLSEIIISDEKKLLKSLKLSTSKYSLFPAMHPDVVFDCYSKKDLDSLIKLFTGLRDIEGNTLIKLKYQPIGLRVNFSLGRETKALKKNKRIYNIDNGTKESIDFYGLKIIKRDKGSAYHCPKGILISYGKNAEHFGFENLETIDTCKIKKRILSFFKI